MFPALLFSLMLGQGPSMPAVAEPDGSRTVGVVPPFTGNPAPPVWLRGKSHSLAALDCRHYLYEAYGNGKGLWLVRYLSFPEAGEAYRELEQVFLFTADGKVKVEELKVSAVRFEPLAAIYQGKSFALADRRDLLKP